jgi:hypothetical protein
MKRILMLTGAAALFAYSIGTAHAADNLNGPPCVSGQPGRGGVVTEHSREPNTTFIIHLTDFNYNVIPGKDIHPASKPDGHGGTTIDPVNVPVMKDLCDARNETIKPPQRGGRVGPKADLSIESVFFDSATSRFILDNIFGTIALKIGTDTPVAIPDLYIADDSGVAQDDTTLYSLVDLATYLDAIPSFTEGQEFDVVNGAVAGLPDMLFSATPFVFDPSMGFIGTPYSGKAVAETQHGFTATPEPATLALFGAWLVGIAVSRWRSELTGLKA